MSVGDELPDRAELVARARRRLAAATERLASAEHRLELTLEALAGCDDPIRRGRLEDEASRHRAALAVQREAIREQTEHLRHLGVEHPEDPVGQ